jgi:hypothetical protein
MALNPADTVCQRGTNQSLPAARISVFAQPVPTAAVTNEAPKSRYQDTKSWAARDGGQPSTKVLIIAFVC